jgi:hypothetical protein
MHVRTTWRPTLLSPPGTTACVLPRRDGGTGAHPGAGLGAVMVTCNWRRRRRPPRSKPNAPSFHGVPTWRPTWRPYLASQCWERGGGCREMAMSLFRTLSNKFLSRDGNGLGIPSFIPRRAAPRQNVGPAIDIGRQVGGRSGRSMNFFRGFPFRLHLSFHCPVISFNPRSTSRVRLLTQPTTPRESHS